MERYYENESTIKNGIEYIRLEKAAPCGEPFFMWKCRKRKALFQRKGLVSVRLGKGVPERTRTSDA